MQYGSSIGPIPHICLFTTQLYVTCWLLLLELMFTSFIARLLAVLDPHVC